MIDIQSILAQLDKEAEVFCFPMLDNGYYFHGDQKLSVFADENRWSLLIEVLQYNNHEYDVNAITNTAYTFGNCIAGKLYDNDNFFYFASDDGVETFLEDEEDYRIFLNPEAKSIKVRDNIIPINHEPAFYLEKGIQLEFSSYICPHELMRSILPEYSDLFWVRRNEIIKLPSDLPEILTLREWFHPDLAMGQKPSETETFQQLAKVVATRDISHYQPTVKPNTHWRNWPEGGKL